VESISLDTTTVLVMFILQLVRVYSKMDGIW